MKGDLPVYQPSQILRLAYMLQMHSSESDACYVTEERQDVPIAFFRFSHRRPQWHATAQRRTFVV